MPESLYSNNSAAALSSRVSVTFGQEGTSEGEFREPSFLAVDSQGNIVVSDTSNHRIQVFDAMGSFVRSFGSEGSEKGQFNSPSGLVVDAKGRLAIVDRDNSRVQLFSILGEYLDGFGCDGSEPGQFKTPRDICTDQDGNFVVADFDNNRIQVFSPSGSFIRQVGKEGGGPGEFHGPSNVTVNKTGSIIVTDMLNCRIQQLAPDGSYMRELNGPSNDEHFIGTVGLCAINDDEILATETESHRIMVISLSSGVTKIYDGHGSEPGSFHNPSHAALDGQGRLVVADMGNNRIQIIPP